MCEKSQALYVATQEARTEDDIRAAVEAFIREVCETAEHHLHAAMVGSLISMLAHERESYDALSAKEHTVTVSFFDKGKVLTAYDATIRPGEIYSTGLINSRYAIELRGTL